MVRLPEPTDFRLLTDTGGNIYSSRGPQILIPILNSFVVNTASSWGTKFFDLEYAMSGDFELSWVPGVTSHFRYFGVSYPPLATRDASYSSSFDFSLYMQTGGALQVYELGVNTATIAGGYDATGRLMIKRVGTTITVLRAGVLKHTSGTTFTTADMQGSAHLNSNGAEINDVQVDGVDASLNNSAGGVLS